jgi:hypothetical protein
VDAEDEECRPYEGGGVEDEDRRDAATERRRPASAGPAKKPTLSIVEEATFAAVRSLGLSASCGRNDACADRNGVAAIAVAIANAKTT